MISVPKFESICCCIAIAVRQRVLKQSFSAASHVGAAEPADDRARNGLRASENRLLPVGPCGPLTAMQEKRNVYRADAAMLAASRTQSGDP
jgi:hypothetical protein